MSEYRTMSFSNLRVPFWVALGYLIGVLELRSSNENVDDESALL